MSIIKKKQNTGIRRFLTVLALIGVLSLQYFLYLNYSPWFNATDLYAAWDSAGIVSGNKGDKTDVSFMPVPANNHETNDIVPSPAPLPSPKITVAIPSPAPSPQIAQPVNTPLPSPGKEAALTVTQPVPSAVPTMEIPAVPSPKPVAPKVLNPPEKAPEEKAVDRVFFPVPSPLPQVRVDPKPSPKPQTLVAKPPESPRIMPKNENLPSGEENQRVLILEPPEGKPEPKPVNTGAPPEGTEKIKLPVRFQIRDENESLLKNTNRLVFLKGILFLNRDQKLYLPVESEKIMLENLKMSTMDKGEKRFAESVNRIMGEGFVSPETGGKGGGAPYRRVFDEVNKSLKNLARVSGKNADPIYIPMLVGIDKFGLAELIVDLCGRINDPDTAISPNQAASLMPVLRNAYNEAVSFDAARFEFFRVLNSDQFLAVRNNYRNWLQDEGNLKGNALQAREKELTARCIELLTNKIRSPDSAR